ncbi:UDP-N-acetylglucosamine transferase subunit [Madurella fahalii]|uniref:UDP-N-acetylglucosamine transferase subunit ALG14 n=1 Tax=Madurella fahalii TaxID=1157608 RepID=A0ABQ0G6V1_9PEZI
MDRHKSDLDDVGSFSQTHGRKSDDKARTDQHQGDAIDDPDVATLSPAHITTSEPTTDKKTEMQEMRELLEDLGEDRYTVTFYFGCLAVSIISSIGFFLLPWSWIVAIICVLFRHVSIKNEHPGPQTGRRWIERRKDDPAPDTSRLPAVYFLYILGSGGHTTEMLETVKRKFQPQPNQHRRYVITTGDSDSLSRVIRLETAIKSAVPDARRGTIDAFTLPRARRVHQPLWTAPLTCAATAAQAVNALTRAPNARPRSRHGRQFKYPHVVVTNGPATGFIVCLVAHLLKIFYLVPQNRLKMVYIESWARTRTLSLTGKLFLWTAIADLFCVQHEELARMTGGVYVGAVAANVRS